MYIRLKQGSQARIDALLTLITANKVTPDEFVKEVGIINQTDLRGLIHNGFIGMLLNGSISWGWLAITELNGYTFNRRTGDTVFEVVNVMGKQPDPLIYKTVLVGIFTDFLLLNPRITEEDVIRIFGGVPDSIHVTYREYGILKERGQDGCFNRVEFTDDALHLTDYINANRTSHPHTLAGKKNIYLEEWYGIKTYIY